MEAKIHAVWLIGHGSIVMKGNASLMPLIRLSEKHVIQQR
jgi:hypothetical protein